MEEHEDITPATREIPNILLILFVLAGIGLRVYTLSMFEFKADQALAIHGGHETVSKIFLIDHGMTSGPGIPNPPMLYWLMGLISLGASTPTHYALVVLLTSVAALCIWIVGMRKLLRPELLLLCATFLSISPPLVIYSTNIWAQAFLPVTTVSLFVCLCHFLNTRKEVFWIAAIWLNAIAAGLHLSGAFLIPLTLILGIRPRVSLRGALTAIVPVLALFAPYLIYVGTFLSYNSPISSGMRWTDLTVRTFQYFSQFNSVDFFRYYVGTDLDRMLQLRAGVSGARGLSFIAGIGSSILVFASLGFAAAMMTRSRHNSKPAHRQLFEVSVTAFASFQIVVVLLGYTLLGIKSYPHYFLVTVPATAVTLGYFLTTIPLKKTRRAIAALVVLSTMSVNMIVLTSIHKGGGHPQEYGLHHGLMMTLKQEYEELQRKSPELAGVTIHVDSLVPTRFDPDAALSVIDPAPHSAGADGGERAILTLKWNTASMEYEHTWSSHH